MFDSLCVGRLTLLPNEQMTLAVASLSLMQMCLTFEFDDRLLSGELSVTSLMSPLSAC